MQARPRHAENRVAEELNDIFMPLGYGRFVRIPTTGRTGPDLSINKTNLVVDVKSRKRNPKKYFQDCYDDNGNLALVRFYDHCTIALKNIPLLAEEMLIHDQYKSSVTVEQYLSHMHEWTQENLPNVGISCIVLHMPGLPYGMGRLVFYYSDIGKIRQLFHKGEN